MFHLRLAGNDVFGLQRCGLPVLLGASFREPSLSRPQIVAAQNKAVVLAVCVPLNCTGEQTRVRVDPIEIGIECADQRISRFLKIIALPEENPVQLSPALRAPYRHLRPGATIGTRRLLCAAACAISRPQTSKRPNRA